ncbi:endonuclease domain-containing protein [Prosthecomicrobium pneumaticum]|uniref:Very-short-patch-repair endonuclease n=1 Tax=Prosthecomicrobium pneumaticum TaxID=81895 RepID=A0A7W9FMX8_9HYPH|nr:endonuclease domain-containing protein [Prosthecomicrobium pneumaticum]MBB5753558.1 very-short-patch-repair endonuclease [Prosthecomicrobium pneumaticum]
MPHRVTGDRQRVAAKRLRSEMTDAERAVWNLVRAHRLNGLGFRRQVPIGSYVVDFCCHEARLVLEIDGSQHAEDEAVRDAVRTRSLEEEGYRVIRFWNADVLRNIGGVAETILAMAPPRTTAPDGAEAP